MFPHCLIEVIVFFFFLKKIVSLGIILMGYFLGGGGGSLIRDVPNSNETCRRQVLDCGLNRLIEVAIPG